MSHTDGNAHTAGNSTRADEDVLAAGPQGADESPQGLASGKDDDARVAGPAAAHEVARGSEDARGGEAARGEDAVRQDDAVRDGADQASVDGQDETNAGDRFEEEGDIAADYLEELLDIADIDGDIDIEVRAGRTYISILNEEGSNEQLASLIGRDGETLEALQELARLAVLTSTGNRSRLVLDITGYREGRATELRRIAEDAVARARETNEHIALDPMSAYERKLVHDVVAEHGLFSESEGEGPRRHIVVSASGE